MHSFKPVQKRFKSVEGQVTNYKLIFFQFQVLRKSRFAQLHDEGSPASWILLSSHDTESGFIQRQNRIGRWIRTWNFVIVRRYFFFQFEDSTLWTVSDITGKDIWRDPEGSYIF